VTKEYLEKRSGESNEDIRQVPERERDSRQVPERERDSRQVPERERDSSRYQVTVTKH